MASQRGHGLGLVADIGGTNARFALVEIDGDPTHLIALEQLSCADYPSFEVTLESYLRRVGAAPRHGVVAVAGAVRDNAVHFTNLDWQIDQTSLDRAGFQGIRLINDYAAQALALPLLEGDRVFPLGPCSQPGEGTLAVLGPGSGLGVAALVRQGKIGIPLATEGGHADFAPVDEVEIEIQKLLAARHGRVSNELLLSGGGLCRLQECLAAIAGFPVVSLTASEITERGLAGDVHCHSVLLRFCAILGSVAGSVALTLGATGGVFVAGGIAPRLLSLLQESDFRERFEAKPPMRGWLAAVPSLIITDTNSALLGAARLLSER